MSGSHLKKAQKPPEFMEEQGPKLSPILEEEESNVSPEPEDSSGERKQEVHEPSVEQELKLSPIPEETSEEEESKMSPKPVDYGGEHEPMEVLNPDDPSGEPMEVPSHEVSIAKQSLVRDANPNLLINAKAPRNDVSSYSNLFAQADANLAQAKANLVLAQANVAQAQANRNIFNQTLIEGTSLLSCPGVEMEDVNTSTPTGPEDKNVDVAKEVGSSGSIWSTSSATPPESDHVCTETCIHGGAKPKTRSLARTSMNTNAESSNPPHESKTILENSVRLMERMGKKTSQNPARNISREEWEEKLKNASFLTEEFGRPLGYRSIIQMPEDNSSSPYVVVHRQLNRMFLSLSLSSERKSETQPCVVTHCASESALEGSASLQEHNIPTTGVQEKGSTSESKDLVKASNDNDGESKDLAGILHRWKISTGESESALGEKQDLMHKEKIVLEEPEHQDEQMEVPEEQMFDHDKARIEDDDEKEHIQALRTESGEEAVADPQPEQEYHLIGLAPILPPVNPCGPVNPNHPYRERKLDRWRAAMITAYRSERYHTTDLLDHTMSQLEAQGISRDDFNRLYHSTRLIDCYRDDGVHEAPTFSELRDMDLEDRINQIIIAVGYMTVAMLYMRLQAERNPEVPVVSEDSSESSVFDSGNIDSLESDPSVQYAPLREHVNIDIAESLEGGQSTSVGKLSPESCSTTSTDIYFDTHYQSIINPPGDLDSLQGIQSPGKADSSADISSPNIIAPLNSLESNLTESSNTDYSQGIGSPDIIAPPNSGDSNLSDPQSVLIPLQEVAKRCQTSSSQQSLLNESFDTSDGDSLPPEAPHSVEDELKREAVRKSYRDCSEQKVFRDLSPTPSEGESEVDPQMSEGAGLGIGTVGDLINVMVHASLQQSMQNMSVDTTDEDSSQSETPPHTPSQSPPYTPSQPPYTPSSSPPCTPSPTLSQAHSQIPHYVRDDLRRKAILKSYRRSSQDAVLTSTDKEGVLDAPVSKGGISDTLIAGNLVNVLVDAILTDAKHSRSGQYGCTATPESSTDQLNIVGDNDESSSAQDGARESDNANESTGTETRVLSGDVETKSTDNRAESWIKEGTEDTSDKGGTSESTDKPEDDIPMKDADTKMGKHCRKRKEHSDSDDEFQQLPKRSHTEY